MSSFEFVFGMISVITSLALTRLLSGCVGLYRNSERVRFSWRHGCWTALAFMLLIGNWATLWRLHDIQAWSALDVLSQLVFVSVLYAFCDLVMPDEPQRGEVLDLREYHVRQGRRYMTVQLLFVVLALLVIAHGSNSFAQWLGASAFALVAGALTAIALGTRRVWLDTLIAVAMALMGVLFMWLRLGALAA